MCSSTYLSLAVVIALGCASMGFSALAVIGEASLAAPVKVQGFRDRDAMDNVSPREHQHEPQVAENAARPWVGRLQKASNDRGYIDSSNAFVLPLCRHFGEAFSAF
ncbi:MAG TPA: hypothetical protein VNJ02_03405, partial [Vicinamibacterales bacterium]|nr:hypothetical protein [Vicinamibacterales bacterium]